MAEDENTPLLAESYTPIQEPAKRGKCLPYRYGLALLSFGGFTMALSFRLNFNIALVAMVNFTTSDNYTSDECKEPSTPGNKTSVKEGDFYWNTHEQSLLLGGFFYGYVLTQFLGGYVAEMVGPKVILLMTVLVSSVINLVTPLLADWNVTALFISRILMGIAQGPLYPASNALWSRWAPIEEKTKLYTFAVSGAGAGAVLGPLLTGFLCDLNFWRGWPLSFYSFGILGLLWCILWVCFAHNSPETHKSLSQQERNYILKGRHFSTTNMTLKRPWLSMFTSGAVWAVLLFSFFDGLAYYALFSGVPIYMKQILRFDISEDGFTFALPFLAMFILAIVSGNLADKLRKRRFTTKFVRQMATLLGEGSQVGFIIGMGFLPCSRVAAVSLYIVAMTMIGFAVSGPSVNCLDIAPKYAGTLMGVTNFLGNIGGFVSPLIVGAITNESPDRKDWQKVFFMTAGAYAMATVSFIVLAKGEEQPWARDGDTVTMVTDVGENSGNLQVSVNSGDESEQNRDVTATSKEDEWE